MVGINDYCEEKSCIYKDEEYLVRDNGSVLRKTPAQKKVRKLDNIWTFGRIDKKTGYLEIGSARVHRIVATAFHGEPPNKEYVVDHIDTNRQNNRPSNLRWLTKLENVVLNPVTRKRIEYRTGVSIFEFLKNPSAYKDAFEDPDFSWMRRVTEDEAKACLENIRKWNESEKTSQGEAKSKIGEWIYQSQKQPAQEIDEIEKMRHQNSQVLYKEKSNITNSLTPLALQRDWKTPTRFLCCPEQVLGEPIECYLKNLSVDVIFSSNRYGESLVDEYASVGNSAIVVITYNKSSIKPLALVKITFEDGYYVHSSLGTFFSGNGAKKQFTLAQGLEWTGEDSIDDYC